jgi:glycosyltransferase involved in cell wall biosynthesis
LIPLAIVNIPKVDIAHLTLSGFPVIPALIANYKYGTKIMLTEHGVFIRERLLAISNSEYPYFLKSLLIRFSEAIARLAYYKADVIISVTTFNQKWEKWYGADPKKFKIIYNGIDPEVFKPGPKPSHLKGIPTVVAVARVFELKDILTMIRSCAVVKKTIPEVQYLVYGDNQAVPEYTKECLELVDELNLQNNFKFMGPRSDPHNIFLEGDLSILTSISEGFPYTVIESLGCGIPVVSTEVGGVREALDDSCGFTCKPKDAEAIGNAVIKLLLDKDLRKTMGENAREKVLKNFTLNKFVNEYEDVYKDIMQTKKAKFNLAKIEDFS